MAAWIVIALIGMELRRPFSRSPTRFQDVRNRINQRLKELGIMHIRGGMLDHERDSLGIDHKMALRALFAAVGRIWPGFLAPPGAGTLPESRAARDQSI